jgi:hypothetical protein
MGGSYLLVEVEPPRFAGAGDGRRSGRRDLLRSRTPANRRFVAHVYAPADLRLRGLYTESFDTVRLLSRGTGRRAAGDSSRTNHTTSSTGSKTSCRKMWQSHKRLCRSSPVLLHYWNGYNNRYCIVSKPRNADGSFKHAPGYAGTHLHGVEQSQKYIKPRVAYSERRDHAERQAETILSPKTASSPRSWGT